MSGEFERIQLLSAFRQVALDGSFTKAAESLSTSKSHLSKQVKQLEEQLRVQLLHRTTRVLTLTEAGKALLGYSEKMKSLINDAAAMVQDLKEDTVGTLRFTCPVSLGESMLPHVLKEFCAQYPRVKVDIDLSNEQRKLVEGDFDLALRTTSSPDLHLVARPLGHIADTVVASPEFIDAYGRPTHPEQLSGLPCLVNNREKDWNQWLFTSGNEELRVDVHGDIACNQYGMLKQCALAGLGIAKLPYYEVATQVADGTLIALLEDFSTYTHQLFIVYPSQRYQPKKLLHFKSLLIDWFDRKQR